MFREVSNISKVGECTTSLGNLCSCSVTVTVKKSFIMFRCILLCFSWCSLPFVLETTCSELGFTFFTAFFFRYLYTLVSFPLNLLFSRLSSSLSQCFLIWEMLLILVPFCWPLSSSSISLWHCGTQNCKVLYLFFSYLGFTRSSMFIHTDLLIFLPGFLLIRVGCF